MTKRDGRAANRPYRVRVGDVWYWVDPTVPADAIEPGDLVVLYPVEGDAQLARLQSSPGAGETIAFAALDGTRFDVPVRAVAMLHLAAVDEVQD